jgi:SAM-dependent methyltransferase
MRKSPRARFLAANPFPHPLTDGLFYREKMRAIHQVAPDRIGSDGAARVLEVGGGRSGLGVLLYPQALVITLDRDASQFASGARNVCGDARRLPFADATFDVVTLFDVLEHVDDDMRAAHEALRVTRPGGWLLVSTPNADWRYPSRRALRRWCPHESELMREWGHVRRGYAGATLEGLFGAAPLRRAGFVNPLTALFHDISFSHLRGRRRRLAYALATIPVALGYALHRPGLYGSETAYAWRRE